MEGFQVVGHLSQFMRHDLMSQRLVALPAGTLGDQYLLVLVDDFRDAGVTLDPSGMSG